jgi:hypothetical protein
VTVDDVCKILQTCESDNLNKNNGSVVAQISPRKLTSIYILPEDAPRGRNM